ncbi:MAG: hypothetical protein WCG75_12220 [Armatimonadota bacterium]
MVRWGIVAVVLACSCKPNPESGPQNPSAPNPNTPFVKSQTNNNGPKLIASEEATVISTALNEFFATRWQDWRVGEFVAIQPNWVNGQFDSESFDKALQFWTTKFGNDQNLDEETLKRIRATLDTANSSPGTTSNVQKGLAEMDLDARIVIVPTTYFDKAMDWVPGSYTVVNRQNEKGGIRAAGALTYPLFSGNNQCAFFQLNQVKSGREYGQLHFFLEKQDGKWKVLAVGRKLE